jgi:hypothetical protein
MTTSGEWCIAVYACWRRISTYNVRCGDLCRRVVAHTLHLSQPARSTPAAAVAPGAGLIDPVCVSTSRQTLLEHDLLDMPVHKLCCTARCCPRAGTYRAAACPADIISVSSKWVLRCAGFAGRRGGWAQTLAASTPLRGARAGPGRA